jgi:competence protein ComEC
MTIALSHCYYLKKSQLTIIPKQSITIQGKILGLPIEKEGRIKLEIELQENELGIKKVLSTWYENSSTKSLMFRTGQVWLFELKLKPNHHNFNPGSYDYSKWLFRNRFDAVSTIKSAELILDSSNDLLTTIHNIRFDILNLIERNINSQRVQALIKALTIGDKSQISFEDAQVFRQTGTAHIIAISGLHIGLIAFIGILIGRVVFIVFTLESVNRQTYEVFFAFSLAFVYTFLAGFSISTVRALIMLSVFLASYLGKKPITRWHTWCIALVLVLLIDPLNVLDPGFWLSFLAVALLIFVFAGKRCMPNKLIAFIKAQIILLIGLLPLSVLVFGNINFLTPISNFIVLPFASMLMIPLIFISLISSMFSNAFSEILFNFSEFICLQFFKLLDGLAEVNFLLFSVNNSINSIVLLSMISIVLLLPKIFRWKYLVLFLLLPVFFRTPNKLENKEFLINVLDVGQGLSVVIETRNHIIIYDTGARFDSGFNMVSSVVLPFLKDKDIDNVNRIILSHSDNDHSGGIDYLIEKFNSVEIFAVDGEFNTCNSKLSWSWDGVQFQILSPYEIVPYLGNNSSCVLKVSNLNNSILLTGDIGEPVEYRLLKNNSQQIESNVLLVPHHGSKSSSTLDFIRTVNPEYAINSSGFANQFNHPHPIIKQLYLDQGIKFIDTQNSGAIQIKFSDHGIEVEEYRKTNPKIWHVNTN